MESSCLGYSRTDTWYVSDLWLTLKLLTSSFVYACLLNARIRCAKVQPEIICTHTSPQFSNGLLFQIAYSRLSYGPFNIKFVTTFQIHLFYSVSLYLRQWSNAMGSLISCCCYFCYSYAQFLRLLGIIWGQGECVFSLSTPSLQYRPYYWMNFTHKRGVIE